MAPATIPSDRPVGSTSSKIGLISAAMPACDSPYTTMATSALTSRPR